MTDTQIRELQTYHTLVTWQGYVDPETARRRLQHAIETHPTLNFPVQSVAMWTREDLEKLVKTINHVLTTTDQEDS